jgi:diguanylate cyclase (GGDEF)-like protein
MDLATLWYLTLGTLLVAAAMTLWERAAHPQRAPELGLWAAAYGVFAAGCALAMNRSMLPGVAGSALTNVVMMLGYMLVLQGVLRLDDRKLPGALTATVLAAIGAAWFVAGTGLGTTFWNYVSAFPIAAVSGLTALALLRSRTARGLRSRPIAIAVFACHGIFNLARTFVAPIVAAQLGDGVPLTVAKMTMYEAVLFSVAMPMSLLALVREEERAQLLTAARTDFLTGLHNRQGFFELGPDRLRLESKGAPGTLLAFDLDHFKAINDTYGHEAGDRVLKLFAEIACTTAPRGAMCARLGGEEFAILLPGTGLEEARRIGAEVAQRFAEAARSDEPAIAATVSVGLAEAAAGKADLAELLAAADRALYKAKLLGRNRIEVAEPVRIAAAA